MASAEGEPVNDEKYLDDDISDLTEVDLIELARRLRTASQSPDLDDETARVMRQMASFLIHLDRRNERFANIVKELDASIVRLRHLAELARVPASTRTR